MVQFRDLSKNFFFIPVAIVLGLPFVYGGLHAYISPMDFKNFYGEETLSQVVESDAITETSTVQAPSYSTGNRNHQQESVYPNIANLFPAIYLTNPAPEQTPEDAPPENEQVDSQEADTAESPVFNAPVVPAVNTFPNSPSPQTFPTQPVQIAEQSQVRNIDFIPMANTYRQPQAAQNEVLAAFENSPTLQTTYPLQQPNPAQFVNSNLQRQQYQNYPVSNPTQLPNIQNSISNPTSEETIAWMQNQFPQTTNQTLQFAAQYGYYYAAAPARNALPASGPEMIALTVGCFGGTFGMRFTLRKKSA